MNFDWANNMPQLVSAAVDVAKVFIALGKDPVVEIRRLGHSEAERHAEVAAVRSERDALIERLRTVEARDTERVATAMRASASEADDPYEDIDT